MIELWVSIAVFSLFHALPSTPLRRILIENVGRPWFMALYSLVSLALFFWLFLAFWRADHGGPYFVTGPAVRALSAGLMLAALWFFAAALLRKPPVLLTAETVLQDQGSVSGVVRITRHPFLWALGLWAFIHLLNNADPAGLVLFGYFFVLAVAGTLPIDHRRARLIGEKRWQQILGESSNIPFVAIARGRQNLVVALKEVGWRPSLAALAAWAFILHYHEMFFGLPVFY
jgi:uncharacterized membrane protein